MPNRITSEHELLSFDPTSVPACELDPGDIVSIETSVAILRQLAAGATLDSVDLERANAVTGPVFVGGQSPVTRCGSRSSRSPSSGPGSSGWKASDRSDRSPLESK